MANLVLKILHRSEWAAAVEAGVYLGSADDLRDGFIHFSTSEQVAETAAKHFAGQHDLLLVAVPETSLGQELKWETSRNGERFPHLYGPLDPSLSVWADDMPLDPDGTHVLPERLIK